ncbi:MAG: PD-(D/E)XK nuclease family transposase [Bacteroidales bacterium]|nr:PD-(D/E)XK nuclease family transposase [Bacteroidales bacterium]
MFFSRFARNFDLLCKEEATGEEFIVEMQFGKHNTYRERMLSYATYPIRTQLAEKLGRYQPGSFILSRAFLYARMFLCLYA